MLYVYWRCSLFVACCVLVLFSFVVACYLPVRILCCRLLCVVCCLFVVMRCLCFGVIFVVCRCLIVVRCLLLVVGCCLLLCCVLFVDALSFEDRRCSMFAVVCRSLFVVFCW